MIDPRNDQGKLMAAANQELEAGVWGRLTSLSKKFKNQQITEESFCIGRLPSNNLQITD